MKTKRRIIVITGTPCVGKTSVSEKLAEKINALHINLAELVKKEKLYTEIDKERDTLIADMNKVSLRIRKLIEDSNVDVIVDGHYAVNVLKPEIVDFVFILRKDPVKLKTLMEKRGYTGRKLWENLEAEILDVCLTEAVNICGKEKVCEIDTTDKSIDEIVSEIMAVINSKEKCRVGVIDWISKLEQRGILDDFLRNLP